LLPVPIADWRRTARAGPATERESESSQQAAFQDAEVTTPVAEIEDFRLKPM